MVQEKRCEVIVRKKLVWFCSASLSEGWGKGEREERLGGMKSSLDYHSICPIRRYIPEGDKFKRHYNIKTDKPKMTILMFCKESKGFLKVLIYVSQGRENREKQNGG